MTRREKRAKLRRNRRIERQLERLEAVDTDRFGCTNIEEMTEFIDAVHKIGCQIKGSGGLYPRVNRLYSQAVRQRRVMVDVAEMLIE